MGQKIRPYGQRDRLQQRNKGKELFKRRGLVDGRRPPPRQLGRLEHLENHRRAVELARPRAPLPAVAEELAAEADGVGARVDHVGPGGAGVGAERARDCEHVGKLVDGAQHTRAHRLRAQCGRRGLWRRRRREGRLCLAEQLRRVRRRGAEEYLCSGKRRAVQAGACWSSKPKSLGH
eukprot:6179891-Pleurochrysis_carterae.AAC.2